MIRMFHDACCMNLNASQKHETNDKDFKALQDGNTNFLDYIISSKKLLKLTSCCQSSMSQAAK